MQLLLHLACCSFRQHHCHCCCSYFLCVGGSSDLFDVGAIEGLSDLLSLVNSSAEKPFSSAAAAPTPIGVPGATASAPGTTAAAQVAPPREWRQYDLSPSSFAATVEGSRGLLFSFASSQVQTVTSVFNSKTKMPMRAQTRTHVRQQNQQYTSSCLVALRSGVGSQAYSSRHKLHVLRHKILILTLYLF